MTIISLNPNLNDLSYFNRIFNAYTNHTLNLEIIGNDNANWLFTIANKNFINGDIRGPPLFFLNTRRIHCTRRSPLAPPTIFSSVRGSVPVSLLFFSCSFYAEVTTVRIFVICMRHDSTVNVGRRELSWVSGPTTHPYERFNLRSPV